MMVTQHENILNSFKVHIKRKSKWYFLYCIYFALGMQTKEHVDYWV